MLHYCDILYLCMSLFVTLVLLYIYLVEYYTTITRVWTIAKNELARLEKNKSYDSNFPAFSYVKVTF